ncbi:hypothetical protein [Treponema pectinovorum]|nr:hypothetical protein [Treponema pectinovorum]
MIKLLRVEKEMRIFWGYSSGRMFHPSASLHLQMAANGKTL